jgi:hypothetical protein
MRKKTKKGGINRFLISVVEMTVYDEKGNIIAKHNVNANEFDVSPKRKNKKHGKR